MTSKAKIIVDRLEGDYAVLECSWKRDDGAGRGPNKDEDVTTFDVPRCCLPKGIREGDEVVFADPCRVF